MADTVWAILESYGLTEKGATTRPLTTLMVGLETRFSQIGITTSNVNEVSMRCFLHTTLLTVLQFIEAIGAVEKPDPTSQAAYQEMVAMPVNREYDDDGLGDNRDDVK
ncbi:hypothetical protein B0H13DRAFT_2328769 [Mycena leptocephala]|nr:hypothetical protein B0H13DRAFT_2328769 [Mycena leptocephala]